MDQNSRWAFIINPVAGGGFASTLAGKIDEMVNRHGLTADVVYTAHKGHATELSRQLVEKGYRYIIGVGGDGTLNEIAAPLVGNKEVVTGLIAGGTGNDFVQITGFPGRFQDRDWESFFQGKTMPLDAGLCNDKIFLNGMGLGFDAEVAAQNYTAPGEVKPGGKNKYVWHILKTLLFFKEKKMTVLANGHTSTSDCFINTIAIGRRFAGGFFLTPQSIANDGLLDVCAIKRLSLPKRLYLLPKVPKGTHIHNSHVHYYQTESLSLEFPTEVPFHVDGELYFARHFEVRVIPAALNIIYNPAGNHYFATNQN
jgi:YegS/Rv2252/BmrU family lipid kinase